jgi:hypothetical protein
MPDSGLLAQTKARKGVLVTCANPRGGKRLVGITLTKTSLRELRVNLAVAGYHKKGIAEWRLLVSELLPRGPSPEDERLRDFIDSKRKPRRRAKDKQARDAARKAERKKARVSAKTVSRNTPLGGPSAAFSGRQRVSRRAGNWRAR